VKDDTKDGLGALAIVLGLMALGGVIGLVIWGASVLLSPVVGAGNVHKDVNDAKNREHWQAQYWAEYNQLQADKRQIGVLKTSYDSSRSEQDRIDLEGAQNNCQQDVARYNGDTQNVLGAKWLPEGLPSQVADGDMCEPQATASR